MKKEIRIATLVIALGLIAAIVPVYADEFSSTNTTAESADNPKAQTGSGTSQDLNAGRGSSSGTVTVGGGGIAELNDGIPYCQSLLVRTTLTQVCLPRPGALRPKPIQQMISFGRSLGLANRGR